VKENYSELDKKESVSCTVGVDVTELVRKQLYVDQVGTTVKCKVITNLE